MGIKYRFFAADFETTVYSGQKDTQVWSAASVELGSEEVLVYGNIGALFDYYESLKCNCVAYFHNLKFDGAFWLNWLLSCKCYTQAFVVTDEVTGKGYFLEEKEMPNCSFKYSISAMGQWYSVTIKTKKGKIITFRDSTKLLPFSLERIGESFKTKHKKLTMEYKGFRYPNCPISQSELMYIKNDVLVLKEALEFMFAQGHNKLTIGSCCLYEFKKGFSKEDYDVFFPDIYKKEIDADTYGSSSAGAYVHKSYKGGWCYLVRGKENKIYHGGTTADVNSLYPSMMSSESGNYYPVGRPRFWKGDFPGILDIPTTQMYFFIRIKTRFYLKKGKLPFIQIKGSWLYPPNTALETSDVYNQKTGGYSAYYRGLDGDIHDTRVTLTLTCTDYRLFLEHYNVRDFEVLDGCYFDSEIGLFDTYIEKYKKIKLESSGAMRELAKLFLNNLYGKMAASKDSSFKVARLKEDGSLGFYDVTEDDKTPGYIPVGSAITSYARCFTIRAAQQNYHGPVNRGFIYADTDSIHCDLKPEEIVGISVHDKNFCCWKLESCWDEAIFVRQKTYIEHVTHENLMETDRPYYNVKCAGMPKRCKELLVAAITGRQIEITTEEEHDFLFKENERKKLTLSDFKVGIKIPGKLRPKQINGGVLLVDTDYTMR